MRRFFCLLLCLLCFAPACAEGAGMQEEANYIHLYDLGFPMRQLCMAIGADVEYVHYDKRVEPQFNDDVLQCLLRYQEGNGLEPSGVFDPDTLRCILEIPEPDFGSLLVWIPMHGGTKYHITSTCSNMDQPRQMPVDCAALFDYSSCKRCHTDEKLLPYGWVPG